MTDDQIQELVLSFLDGRGGYVAGASERELFLTIKGAVLMERSRIACAVQDIRADYPADVFTGQVGVAVRHIADRVLEVVIP